MEGDSLLAAILGAVLGGLLGFFGPIAWMLLQVLCGDLPDESLPGWSCFLAPCLAFLGSLIGYTLAEEIGFRKLPPIPKNNRHDPDDSAGPGPTDANES